MKIFALIMLFVLFVVLQHLTNWLLREDRKKNEPLAAVGALFSIIISVVVCLFIYHGSYELKEEYVRNPSQYQMTASDSGYTFYDYDRRVGFIPTGNSKLDTLIWNDNL